MIPRDRPDDAVTVSTADSSLTLAIARHLASAHVDVHRDGSYAFTLTRFGNAQPFWSISGASSLSTDRE